MSLSGELQAQRFVAQQRREIMGERGGVSSRAQERPADPLSSVASRRTGAPTAKTFGVPGGTSEDVEMTLEEEKKPSTRSGPGRCS